MANPTDPKFLKALDVDFVRQSLTSAMEMGLPENEEDRLTFRWKSSKTFSGAVDRSGTPFDLTATPTSVDETPDKQVPGAFEFTRIAPDGTPIGKFDHPYVEITLLDVHYEQVKGADQVLLGGDVYDITFVAPPIGLGIMTVHTIFAIAQDES